MHSELKTVPITVALMLAAAACGGGGVSTTNGSGGTGGTSSHTTTSTGSHTTSTTTTTTTSSSMGGSGPTAEKACTDQANAICALRDSCSPNYNVAKVYGTDTICQQRLQQTCLNSLDAMGQANTPAHVEMCAMAYPSESCSDFFDGNPVAACVPPAGTLAMGAACGASGQCQSTFCNVGPYAVCGTCQPLPAAGAPCTVEADCGRDLTCLVPSGSTTGTCAAFVASGGMCLTGVAPCQAGFACVGDDPTTSTMGTCQPQANTVGAACDATRKTMANCDPTKGFACIPSGAGSMGIGTCAAIVLASNGATCGSIGTPTTMVVDCKAGGLCVKAAPNDKTGVCKTAAADGAACDNDPAIGPPCLPPAKCVVPSGSSGTAGTCTVPNAATCM